MFESNTTFPIYYLANQDNAELLPIVFTMQQDGTRFVAE